MPLVPATAPSVDWELEPERTSIDVFAHHSGISPGAKGTLAAATPPPLRLATVSLLPVRVQTPRSCQTSASRTSCRPRFL